MGRSTKHDFANDRYNDLALAIVMQAIDDYKRCNFLIDTIDMRNYKDDISKYNSYTRAAKEIRDVELFFKSPWFYALSGLNGRRALIGLEQTYRDEYYPVRMEEMLDENKIGRFRCRYE